MDGKNKSIGLDRKTNLRMTTSPKNNPLVSIRMINGGPIRGGPSDPLRSHSKNRLKMYT